MSENMLRELRLSLAVMRRERDQARIERDHWRNIAKGLYEHEFQCPVSHNEYCAVDEYEQAVRGD